MCVIQNECWKKKFGFKIHIIFGRVQGGGFKDISRDKGWCCTKLVVISKATVNPRLSASPETPFMPICFFTTNFNRVSQLVQIRMSGDNVLWENFKRMRQRRKKSYEKVWILYGR